MAKMNMNRDVAMRSALIRRDKEIEPNLTQGPPDRKVTWALVKRTVPSFDDEYSILRGFPDV